MVDAEEICSRGSGVYITERAGASASFDDADTARQVTQAAAVSRARPHPASPNHTLRFGCLCVDFRGHRRTPTSSRRAAAIAWGLVRSRAGASWWREFGICATWFASESGLCCVQAGGEHVPGKIRSLNKQDRNRQNADSFFFVICPTHCCREQSRLSALLRTKSTAH
jgi:hypothetical protein